MNYLSVCSGIEAASVAWEPLGFRAVGFSEIEKFPSQVLAHRFPTVRNYGDMTKYKEWQLDEPINILVGGTPCQSFSVAGLRKGLEDPRGNLMLTYLGIAGRLRPKWLVWENVPGVLSSNGGRDFGTFLGALVELGYGFAYRVLDAQWFGVAQRRRRVFVVGCLGDATSASKVFFESESVCRNPAPSREKRQGIATNVAPCLTASNNPSRSPQSSEVTQQVQAILEAQLVGPLLARDYKGISLDDINKAIIQPIAFEPGIAAREGNSSRFSTLAPTLRSNAGDNQPAVAFAQNTRNEVRLVGGDGQIVGALAAQPGMKQTSYIAFAREGDGRKWPAEIASTMNSKFGSKQGLEDQHALGGASYFVPTLLGTMTARMFNALGARDIEGGAVVPVGHTTHMAVRRLTPLECERLQGFPDGWTDIRMGGKPTPDGPRYKAIGNSMAVPVMRWIGERIQKEVKHGRRTSKS